MPQLVQDLVGNRTCRVNPRFVGAQILTLLIFVCPHDVAIIGACFNSCILPNATGMAGLEPTTSGFGDRCATNCATSLGCLLYTSDAADD